MARSCAQPESALAPEGAVKEARAGATVVGGLVAALALRARRGDGCVDGHRIDTRRLQTVQYGFDAFHLEKGAECGDAEKTGGGGH